MAYSFNKSSRTCATCIYWNGVKSIDYAGVVRVDNSQMYGQCSKRVFSSNSAGHHATQPACKEYQLNPLVK